MARTVCIVLNGGAVVWASEEQQSTIDETRGVSFVSLLQASVEESPALEDPADRCLRPPCEVRRRRCEPGFSFSEEVCRCVPSHWRRLD